MRIVFFDAPAFINTPSETVASMCVHFKQKFALLI
jgi:hypothetical protein